MYFKLQFFYQQQIFKLHKSLNQLSLLHINFDKLTNSYMRSHIYR